MKLKLLARLLEAEGVQESAGSSAPDESKGADIEVKSTQTLEDDDTDWGALADAPDYEDASPEDENVLEDASEGEADDEPPPPAAQKKDSPPPAAPQAPAVPASPPPTEETPPAPVVQGQEPSPPQQQQPTTPATPPATPEEQAAKYAEWRDGHVKSLAGQYVISDEEASQILTDPEKVLPQLLAKVHMNAMESAVNAITNALPSMIQSHTQQSSIQQKAQSLFTEVNPDLAKPEYGQFVSQAAQIYRSSPAAKTDAREAFKDIGNMVRVALQLPIPEQAAPPPSASGGAPNGSVPPRPAASRPAAPFQPPRGAGSTATKPVGNMWEQIAEELLEDEN